MKMPLNKLSGDMYPGAWTWNPLAGECRHRCLYCYVSNKLAKRFPRTREKYSGEPRLLEHEMRIPLRKPADGRVIFVCSCSDLFGSWVPDDLIKQVLIKCRKHPENTYLFQSKNPHRFIGFLKLFPPKTILGTTIESDVDHRLSMAPPPRDRYLAMTYLRDYWLPALRPDIELMVSIEPITRFTSRLVEWMRHLKPSFISIGANTAPHIELPEPAAEEVLKLSLELMEFTEVRIKKNLLRLLPNEGEHDGVE